MNGCFSKNMEILKHPNLIEFVQNENMTKIRNHNGGYCEII